MPPHQRPRPTSAAGGRSSTTWSRWSKAEPAEPAQSGLHCGRLAIDSSAKSQLSISDTGPGQATSRGVAATAPHSLIDGSKREVAPAAGRYLALAGRKLRPRTRRFRAVRSEGGSASRLSMSDPLESVQNSSGRHLVCMCGGLWRPGGCGRPVSTYVSFVRRAECRNWRPEKQPAGLGARFRVRSEGGSRPLSRPTPLGCPASKQAVAELELDSRLHLIQRHPGRDVRAADDIPVAARP